MKKINIELNEKELQVIMAGLGELPAKLSKEIIDKIQYEFVEQNQEEK